MSTLSTLDRRVYSLISDSWADGVAEDSGPAPVVLAVSMSVPARRSSPSSRSTRTRQEHFPLLLAVPGWRRARRYVLTSGHRGPKFLSLHEVDSGGGVRGSRGTWRRAPRRGGSGSSRRRSPGKSGCSGCTSPSAEFRYRPARCGVVAPLAVIGVFGVSPRSTVSPARWSRPAGPTCSTGLVCVFSFLSVLTTFSSSYRFLPLLRPNCPV